MDTATQGVERSAPMRRVAASSVVVMVLCENRTFEAFRTASTELEYAQWVVSGRELDELGPGVQDLVAHVEGGEFGAEFTFKVVLQYRWGNGDWKDAGALIPDRTSADYLIGSAFTDRTKLGMKLRVVVRTKLGQGSAISRGNLSVAVAVRLFT